MIRYATIAIVACVYVGLSAWLVSKQGQAYRAGLRGDRLVAGAAEKPAPPPELKNEGQASAVPPDATARIESAPATVAEAPTGEPIPKKTRSHTATTGVTKRKSASKPIADRATDHPPGKGSASADPLAGNPLWTQPQLTKEWDLATLSTADEIKLGAELHELIVSLNPVAADGQWKERVEHAAKPFLATLNRKEIRYQFEIMESNEVNAFSTPGGYVYVNRGLFDLIGEDEDYALEFAIGNEIAHVDLRHAIKCLQDPDVKKMEGGTIRKLYWLVIPFGYLVSDKVNHDYEADDWAFSRMRGFGRSKREALAFLYKLDGYANKHGFRDGRGKVRLAADSSSLLDVHYRRQTAARLRLEHLKESIK
jgi:hypothetical protein